MLLLKKKIFKYLSLNKANTESKKSKLKKKMSNTYLMMMSIKLLNGRIYKTKLIGIGMIKMKEMLTMKTEKSSYLLEILINLEKWRTKWKKCKKEHIL